MVVVSNAHHFEVKRLYSPDIFHAIALERASCMAADSLQRGSLCVGFGGQVAESDRDLYTFKDLRAIVLHNVWRELHEELRLPKEDQELILAL